MAFIDVLKYRGPQNAIVWKWVPEESKWGRRNEELRMGTQLVVNPSFIAVFVSGGQIADIFAPGTYTLSTKNLPILDKLISLPVGGQSPFKAEVYYINKAVLMDTKFGIAAFNITDPNFKTPIPLQCLGSFAFRAGEARSFMTKILGNMDIITPDNLKEYFRGIISEKAKSAIGKVAKEKNLLPMELETICADVAEAITPIIGSAMEKYGIHLEMFNIERISVIYDNPRVANVVDEYQRIMTDDLAERLRLKRRGDHLDVYRTERTFDTTETAASSIGTARGIGGEGNLMGTVVGLGMAQPIAGVMSNVMQGALGGINSNQQVPAQGKTSHNDIIADRIRLLDDLYKEGRLTEAEYQAKKQDLLSKF